MVPLGAGLEPLFVIDLRVSRWMGPRRGFWNCARYIGLLLGLFLAGNVGGKGLEMLLALGLSDPRDSVLLHLVRLKGSPGVSLSILGPNLVSQQIEFAQFCALVKFELYC